VSINAHKGSIVALALDEKGQFLATASDNGTLVRLFAKDGK